MQLVDKLLLLLLVLMLPVGIVASRQLAGGAKTASQDSGIAQLDETLKKIADTQQSGITPPAAPEITITGVVASSSSGTIKVAGVAPKGGVGVTVTATVLPSAAAPATTQDSSAGVLGQAVELRSVRTKVDGSFVFEYPTKGLSGIVELSFEQAGAGKVVQFDLGINKQVL